jgi:FAD/FMN-containing dehydrogenase
MEGRRILPGRLTRRSFTECATATLLFGGMGELSGFRAQSASLSGDLPDIEGQLLADDAARQSIAIDWGYHFHNVPLAVLRPKTSTDVARMVAYANKQGIKIAMRGQGHSLSGQSQVGNGIVIDSSTLNAVGLRNDFTLDAQPGALWGDVGKAALTKGLTPPVMVDAMMLTVGGTLSVGGNGEMGYRFGTQVDHVVELDVVTGTGELLTCSPDLNSELFRMTLAGLGQCGIIVRARLRLIPAPRFVAIRTLTYDDLDAFLADQARLTTVDELNLLNGSVVRGAGADKFLLIAGSFVADAAKGNRSADWTKSLQHKSEGEPTITPYWDYLDRRTAVVARAKEGKIPNPAIIATLPDASVRPFLNYMLSTPEAYMGIWWLEVSPKVTARHTQPLQKMPLGDLSYELRMQRRASADNAPDHQAMLAANEAMLPHVHSAGGKIYPPFAPVLSHEGWRSHYGDTWPRFALAKQQFDPNNVLTPGFGIF